MPVILRWLLRVAPLNPIAVRLVQGGSRRVRHLYIRSAYLAVLVIVLLWALVLGTSAGSLSYRELAAAGAQSFADIAYLQIGLICILAPVFMAGAIAQESNPKTWDILLTSPLSAAHIVLGNLLGRLFFILALLFASLPLFALTQYFGGVPGRSIFTSYLIAACAALLVGAIAIALSVSRIVGKRAVFMFYIATVTYLVVTIAVDRYLGTSGRGAGPGGRGVTVLTGLNPFLALHALLNPSTYSAAPPGSHTGISAWLLERPVASWCIGSILLSLVLTIGSILTVRAGGLGGIGATRSGTPWLRRIFGLGATGSEHRPPRRVWNNPIAWREAAARNSTLSRVLARWAFVALGGAFGLLLVVLFHIGSLGADEFRLAIAATIIGELVVTTLVAINMASTAVSREREDGTLDLILVTPITSAQYLSGKMRGLIAYLLPMLAVPIGTLAAAGIYSLAGGLGRQGGATVAEKVSTITVQTPLVLPEGAILATLVVVPFIAFCCAIGLQWSLKSKGTIASVIATVGVVGVISGTVGLCAWQSLSSIGQVAMGPVLGALSPASVVYAIIYPGTGMEDTVAQHGLASARFALAIGSGIAALVYAFVVYGLRASMVRGFDMTVRKLAGLK